MIKIICKQCNKEFLNYSSNHRQFCSNLCRGNALKGKSGFFFGKHHSEDSRKKVGKALIGKFGELSRNWKGGRVGSGKGYIFLLKHDHPSKDNRGYIREHRIVAEQCLGRYLTKEEMIHHINKIKTDNRPENLYLFASNSQHIKFEHKKNKPILISNLTICG